MSLFIQFGSSNFEQHLLKRFETINQFRWFGSFSSFVQARIYDIYVGIVSFSTCQKSKSKIMFTVKTWNSFEVYQWNNVSDLKCCPGPENSIWTTMEMLGDDLSFPWKTVSQRGANDIKQHQTTSNNIKQHQTTSNNTILRFYKIWGLFGSDIPRCGDFWGNWSENQRSHDMTWQEETADLGAAKPPRGAQRIWSLMLFDVWSQSFF